MPKTRSSTNKGATQPFKQSSSAGEPEQDTTKSSSSASGPPYPVTPDGHYFVVRGRLWRCTNPSLGQEERQAQTQKLMQARRRLRKDQPEEVRKGARNEVNEAKVALGERGRPWWFVEGESEQQESRCDRKMVKNTKYREWFEGLS